MPDVAATDLGAQALTRRTLISRGLAASGLIAVPSLSRPAAGHAQVAPPALASTAQLQAWTAQISNQGLRSTASAAHDRVIRWLEQQLLQIPGIRLREERLALKRWQPTPLTPDGRSRDLARAGGLLVRGDGRRWARLPVIGAVPCSLPTGSQGIAGELVYVPSGQPITAANARGKVVIRDVPSGSIPYAELTAVSYYATPDLTADLVGGTYDRPYLGTDGLLSAELKAAGIAGAAGLLVVFDVPRAQMRGYFDPHHGVHYTVPALYLGVDEGIRVKALAGRSRPVARVTVLAESDRGDTSSTRNLIATLPGRSPERIVLETHTDGATWVQENGSAALLALAHYFAAQPLAARPRTLEFVFASAHLHLSRQGSQLYGAELDRAYDQGTVAFALTLEHLGTRQYDAVQRTAGPGRQLRLAGKGEPTAFVTESPALAQAAIMATIGRGLDRTAVLRDLGAPGGTVPMGCDIGGDADGFHDHLIPTMQVISGPWSLWAPAFGEQAIDFARMRRQVLAAADVTTSLAGTSRDAIAGPFLAYRAARKSGAPTCVPAYSAGWSSQDAPGPGAPLLMLKTALASHVRIDRGSFEVPYHLTGGQPPLRIRVEVHAGGDNRQLIAIGHALTEGHRPQTNVRASLTRTGRRRIQRATGNRLATTVTVTATDAYGTVATARRSAVLVGARR